MCKRELIKLATQDIIVLSHISDIDEVEKEFIINTYNDVHKENFFKMITDTLNEVVLMQATSKKLLAFTFSVGLPFKKEENKGDLL